MEGGIMEEASRGDIMDEESLRRHHGGLPGGLAGLGRSRARKCQLLYAVLRYKVMRPSLGLTPSMDTKRVIRVCSDGCILHLALMLQILTTYT